MLFFHHSSKTVISRNQHNRKWEATRASYDTETYEKSSILLVKSHNNNKPQRQEEPGNSTYWDGKSQCTSQEKIPLNPKTLKRCLLEGGSLKKSFQTSVCLPAQDLREGFYQCPSKSCSQEKGKPLTLPIGKYQDYRHLTASQSGETERKWHGILKTWSSRRNGKSSQKFRVKSYFFKLINYSNQKIF